jgi:hypothetical protein
MSALEEGAAWNAFDEAIADLQVLLRERGLKFTVKWEMTAIKQPKASRSTNDRGDKHETE